MSTEREPGAVPDPDISTEKSDQIADEVEDDFEPEGFKDIVGEAKPADGGVGSP